MEKLKRQTQHTRREEGQSGEKETWGKQTIGKQSRKGEKKPIEFDPTLQ